jgi:hypothetical protein
VLEHDGDSRRIFVRFVGEADGDAALLSLAKGR